MSFTEYMTRSERIQRIGQLLAKGVSLMLMREAEEKRIAELRAQTAAGEQIARTPQDGPKATVTISLNDDESKILEYLRRVKKASPRDMQLCLELSKATLFRRLKRLVESKLVVGSGSTTAIRYRLAEPGDYRVAQTKKHGNAPDVPIEPPGIEI